MLFLMIVLGDSLIEQLSKYNNSYWYDNAQIKWGDSIVRKENEGLLKSKFVIVMLSNNSIEKDGLMMSWKQL
jgi:hypothetical protein